MKKLIALLILGFALNQAQAAVFVDNITETGDFNTVDQLTGFQIAPGSSVLPQNERITSGFLEMNNSRNELRLVLNRRFFCPQGKMCSMVMPAPLVLTVPVVALRSGACGVTLISAESDPSTTNGHQFTIDVIDQDQASCGPAAAKVEIRITEQTHGAGPVVSEITGVPTTIQ